MLATYAGFLCSTLGGRGSPLICFCRCLDAAILMAVIFTTLPLLVGTVSNRGLLTNQPTAVNDCQQLLQLQLFQRGGWGHLLRVCLIHRKQAACCSNECCCQLCVLYCHENLWQYHMYCLRHCRNLVILVAMDLQGYLQHIFLSFYGCAVLRCAVMSGAGALPGWLCATICRLVCLGVPRKPINGRRDGTARGYVGVVCSLCVCLWYP